MLLLGLFSSASYRLLVCSGTRMTARPDRDGGGEGFLQILFPRLLLCATPQRKRLQHYNSVLQANIAKKSRCQKRRPPDQCWVHQHCDHMIWTSRPYDLSPPHVSNTTSLGNQRCLHCASLPLAGLTCRHPNTELTVLQLIRKTIKNKQKER